MQQQTQLNEQRNQSNIPTAFHEQFNTHISELISQPAGDNVYSVAAQYILSSFYQLSSYLFTKKVHPTLDTSQQTSSPRQLSFNSYLQLLEEDLTKFQKIRTHKRTEQGRQRVNMEAELLKCYEKVQGIYFDQKYVLDFSYFELFYLQLKAKNGKQRVSTQMETLCESLDLVQINLFSQIHCKFEEYFKVVANFQYLKQSVTVHLKKLHNSRGGLAKVKTQFLQKSVNLRRKIVQRQNIQRLMKLIKQIKSIKKLPQVLESILASSLPYQSLSLLEDTKSTLQGLRQVRCLRNTSQTIRSMEVLVQNDLTKRYASELYLYLEECHSRQAVNLQQLWRKIQVHTCLDKDSSFVLDQLNSSTNSALSDNPQMQEQIQLLQAGNDGVLASNALIPRHEGKQYQIAMILLQSYKYVAFSPEVTKIKVCNALRIFTKRFQKQLLAYLDQVVISEIESIKVRDKQQQQRQGQGQAKKEQVPQSAAQKKPSEQNQSKPDVVQKVSVEFYIKHLGVLNEIFRQTISRFMGYLYTLASEYEEQFNTQWTTKPESQHPLLLDNHRKFKQIFQQQCSLLPSIFRIIEQKIKYLLTLKNISNIDCLQFYRWITTLKYWQRYFHHLADEHPLLNHQPKGPAQQPVQQLITIVEDNIRRAVTVMGLQSLLYELTVDYINLYHKNTSNNEVVNTLQEDTWQSTEIPAEFSQILQMIFNPEGHILNASVTILDNSTSSNKASLNSSRDKDTSQQQQTRVRIKIKLLKNNILIGGVRYKVNLSFLILCESMGDYIKLARVLSNVLQQSAPNSITSYVYDKLYDLIQVYCLKSRELILDTKALAFGKIKGKSINAKHICLLCNCLSVVQKIAEEMMEPDKIEKLGLAERKNNTIALLENTRGQLISKLTVILNSKTEKQINQFLQQDKLNPQNNQTATKTSNTIITSFLQMVEITDEYLEVEGVKQVLKAAFQTLSQKYLTHLLLKGGKQRAEVEVLIERLKFLRKYFPNQYQALLKEIPN